MKEGGMEPDPVFAADVREGLSAHPKRLPSKHFYDAKGDALFQRIMELDAYYPTRAENAILRDRNAEILQALFPDRDAGMNLIELGSGDGAKTRHLLKAVPEEAKELFRYIPNDISGNVLEALKRSLEAEFPELRVEPMVGDHYGAIEGICEGVEGRKALLFLGGNIGNFDTKGAEQLLTRFGEGMEAGDRLLIGFDLKKDPERIERAYNDPEGVTRDFNLNLLERMNRELGADFDLALFQHHSLYEPSEGEARSYLVSIRDQEVNIQSLGMKVVFEPWEPIFLERSKKFALKEIEALAARTGFRVVEHFQDPDEDFVDSLWEKP